MYRAMRLTPGLRFLLGQWDRGLMSEASLCTWLDSFYPEGLCAVPSAETVSLVLEMAREQETEGRAA